MKNAIEAMGRRPMDELVLSNAWAKVVIVRQEQAPMYIICGDLADTRLSSKQFKTLREALAYAWESLALYQQGRAD